MTNGEKVEPAITHAALPGIRLVMPLFEQTSEARFLGDKGAGAMTVTESTYHPNDLDLHSPAKRRPIQDGERRANGRVGLGDIGIIAMIVIEQGRVRSFKNDSTRSLTALLNDVFIGTNRNGKLSGKCAIVS